MCYITHYNKKATRFSDYTQHCMWVSVAAVVLESEPTVALYDMSILLTSRNTSTSWNANILMKSEGFETAFGQKISGYLACDCCCRRALQNEKSIFQRGHEEFNSYQLFMSTVGLYKSVNVNFTCVSPARVPFHFLFFSSFFSKIKSELFKRWFIHT